MTVQEAQRFFVLTQTDNLWKEHLMAIKFLQQAVGFRGYAQRDPLVEYKLEGYNLFLEMMAQVRTPKYRAHAPNHVCKTNWTGQGAGAYHAWASHASCPSLLVNGSMCTMVLRTVRHVYPFQTHLLKCTIRSAMCHTRVSFLSWNRADEEKHHLQRLRVHGAPLHVVWSLWVPRRALPPLDVTSPCSRSLHTLDCMLRSSCSGWRASS